MKKIIHVENHGTVRLATRYLISEIEKSFEFFETSSIAETFELLEKHDFDLMILDVLIPKGEGFRTIVKIRSIAPNVPILILSQLPEELYAIHYLKSGANGFVSKSASKNEIRDAIHAVMKTGGYISNSVQRQLIGNTFDRNAPVNPMELLSQRELEVMEMLLDSKWTREIAQQLNITESSVSTYKARIFEKMKVSSMIELYVKVESIRNTGF